MYRTFARKVTKQVNNNSRMHMNIVLKYQVEDWQFENSFTEFYSNEDDTKINIYFSYINYNNLR